MGIVITPFTEELEEAVRDFNARMRAGGSSLFFPEQHQSATLPKVDGRAVYDEYFVAVDDGTVRGGYILKQQPFYVTGSVTQLGLFRLPLSEGQIDKRFATLGVQMFLDALRKQPQLYTVGLGGYQEAVAQMLVKAGWNTWPVPFYFRVLHPARFLRNIVYLRRSAFRRAVLDTMAFSGLGWVAIHGYQWSKTRSKARRPAGVEFTVENNFGPWADEIWQAAKDECTLVAVRNAEILNLLYPADEPRWVRLKVSTGGRVVGWAIVLNVPMEAHNYFGNMQVGSLIDCLALSGMESYVTCAAVDYLRSAGADIVVTNLSHRHWWPALEAAGLYEGPSNYIFAASKKVSAMLDPFEQNKQSVHMTRGDGAGAGNLITARK